MRAFAVIMMIQGHTVDTFLANEYRDLNSSVYSIWYTLRGFTAPIFMFTAGMVFTYLLKMDNYKFIDNPRIKKGFKRAILLIGIGYLLRYPTYKIFDFKYVTQSQWDTFFTVDALHLIGFGMLTIIFAVLLAKRAHLNFNLIIYSMIGFLLLLSPAINSIKWIEIFPQVIASYFTKSYGSFFPLFPWLIYVLGGSLLGNYLYKNDNVFLKKRFSFSISTLGSALILISMMFFSIHDSTEGNNSTWFQASGIIFLRLGYVLLLNGIMAFVVRKFNSIPTIINDTGKKTLSLYVIHVIILYGCAWFPGLYKYYSKSFTPVETIIAAILMVVLMLAIVRYSDIIKSFRKRKLAFNKA